MKIIKYKLCNRVNHGTEENPKYEDFIIGKEIRCSSANLEANEAIAMKEAYNGEYTVEDDGQPEPDNSTTDDVLNALLGVE